MSVRDRSTREVSQAKEELLVLKSHTKTKADGIMHIISITCVVNSYSALQQEVKCVEGEGMRAKDAWKRLSEDHQNWPMEEGGDDILNSAYIQVEKGHSGKSCVYIYVLRKI